MSEQTTCQAQSEDQKHRPDFIKNIEKMVDPVEVGSIHFIQGLNKMLPRKVQDLLSKESSKSMPYMGFVVEPYSSFLFFKILDHEKAESLLPDGFKLIKTKAFEEDIPEYYAIIGSFRAHTSAFWGSRIEFYVIAENITTGLLSWIIVDYDSNTIGQDDKHGLRNPNAKESVITINHRGRIFVDVVNEMDRGIVYDFNVNDGEMKMLDQRLWLEGNLSISYGKELGGEVDEVFSLKFEPCEMEKALNIDVSKLNLERNGWFEGLFETQPSKVICFPYAQHFISDSPGHRSLTMNKEELIDSINALDMSEIKTFSVSKLRDLILIQNIVTFVLFITVMILIFF